ncbi:MAG: DUF4258 domain-containing protein [Aquamicrobium sp.]|uniref:DUF4258 domain-containing protein n=1 Tax=Aquamicrobium sp. TaxID=1872579 RepID=UPI00349EA7B4|nr:DUF4258 domain-containing protein [Aquamicrobium sp.]
MVQRRKPLVYTKHAGDAVRERELKREWIEATVHFPEWEEADPRQPIQRRYRTITAHGDRILRVVCLETDAEIRILTAFFDRGARRQP